MFSISTRRKSIVIKRDEHPSAPQPWNNVSIQGTLVYPIVRDMELVEAIDLNECTNLNKVNVIFDNEASAKLERREDLLLSVTEDVPEPDLLDILVSTTPATLPSKTVYTALQSLVERLERGLMIKMTAVRYVTINRLSRYKLVANDKTYVLSCIDV